MNAPEAYHNISHSQLSIARHSGGCTINGHYYHYDEENDRLVRDDIWRQDRAAWKKAERAKWQAAREAKLAKDAEQERKQGRLF